MKNVKEEIDPYFSQSGGKSSEIYQKDPIIYFIQAFFIWYLNLRLFKSHIFKATHNLNLLLQKHSMPSL